MVTRAKTAAAAAVLIAKEMDEINILNVVETFIYNKKQKTITILIKQTCHKRHDRIGGCCVIKKLIIKSRVY